jgi:hypothetical protein
MTREINWNFYLGQNGVRRGAGMPGMKRPNMQTLVANLSVPTRNSRGALPIGVSNIHFTSSWPKEGARKVHATSTNQLSISDRQSHACSKKRQGDTRPTGALLPRLPVSIRRSASLAKCLALLEGDGSQVNVIRRRCCEGVVFLVSSIVCCSVLLCLGLSLINRHVCLAAKLKP